MAEIQKNALRSIIIVGGGSAGWMTAAALSSLLSPESVNITLIESEQIGTVGVGEATIPDMINFNAMLGINEAEFLKATNGTFKLGIEFIDWGQKGESYIHPFGNIGVDMQGIDFHQYWLHAKSAGNSSPLQDYSMCAVAAEHDKFVLPDTNPRSVLSHLRYAYHIDATLYAKFLRDYAEKRGVKRIEGKVEGVSLEPEHGNVSSLTMDNGSQIEGDFFFDCTGFRALLTEKALKVPFTDWSHWLPCDSAQTVASERVGALLPYTKATAKNAGWQWRIPTQHRTGNGHIYSSKFMGDNEAIDILMDGLDSKPLGGPRKINFKTGCRETLWNKNCISIGLSAGFLEPLESTSLFLIQMGISRFITLFPTANVSNVVRDEYNKQMLKEFHQVRDFIILHYAATQRADSPFWNYCRNMSVPESLSRKIDLFREAGRVFRYDDELFSKASWIAVCLGQNVIPKAIDPIVSSLPHEQVKHSLGSMQNAMKRAVYNMPTHEAFLETYGAKPV
ncbi:tryptophan halogenase family protein [Hellea balneolensis]|uniref:tryptophan halogenase family protein n=1 Tax=Hellea balneolensis TaxID=287478 RepID=UPI0003FFA305|nr:tryptophan halogenase family protein [Hellea balneolensis]